MKVYIKGSDGKSVGIGDKVLFFARRSDEDWWPGKLETITVVADEKYWVAGIRPDDKKESDFLWNRYSTDFKKA